MNTGQYVLLLFVIVGTVGFVSGQLMVIGHTLLKILEEVKDAAARRDPSGS